MHDSVIKTTDGGEVFAYEYIDKTRRKRSDKRIIAQRGCQEKFLATSADITIFGGNRGGSKSFSLLMETLKDITNGHFNSILLRNERDDLQDLVNTSYQLYSQFGTYNRSINDMT